MSSRPSTISVIIPAINEEAHLPALLQVLNERRPHEIIVVDGGSRDRTLDICRTFDVKVIRTEPGRGRQLNYGANLSTGDILLFVHADSLLPPGWQEEVSSILNNDCLAGTFHLKFDTDSFWLRLYANCSKWNHRLFTYGDQGLFIRRKDFILLGGFREAILMEDVEILKRLYRSGRVKKSSLPITTSARRYMKGGVLRQQIRNICLLAAYNMGVSGERLARFYPHR